MKMRTGLVGLAILVVAGSLIAYFVLRNDDVSEEYSAAEIVPDFTLPDTDGNALVLSELGGKVRVVYFWASWSPRSSEDLKALDQLSQTYGNSISIVALNRDHESQDGRAYMQQLSLGVGVRFAYDKDDVYFREVGGYNMPETIFVGEDSEVLAHIHGPMSYDEMRQQLDTLLQ